MQDHEAAAGSGDRNVQYAYEDGIAGIWGHRIWGHLIDFAVTAR